MSALIDKLTEIEGLVEQLRAKHQRLRDALAGEIGLVQLLTARDDLRPERDAILSNHRHIEALAALADGDSRTPVCICETHGYPIESANLHDFACPLYRPASAAGKTPDDLPCICGAYVKNGCPRHDYLKGFTHRD